MISPAASSFPGRMVALVPLAVVLGILAGCDLGSAEKPAGRASAGPCDRFASPHGRNRSSGTRSHPWRTARYLAAKLHPGQTGCLRHGTYRNTVTFNRPGRRRARITLRNFPGERARIVGTLTVAIKAKYVTVANLFLDGHRRHILPSPIIAGDHARFVDNAVTNRHQTICFDLGGQRRRVRDVAILRNRVHDCGRLPAQNHHHGIYVGRAIGTRIRQNWIYRNADRGIQLYPNAQGTVITGNVIDRNGEGLIFGGAAGRTSDGTRVHDNVISNPLLRSVVESRYPEGTAPGQDNLVFHNCLWQGPLHAAQGVRLGFVLVDNLIAAPRFRNAASGDYRLRADSPCRALRVQRTRPGPRHVGR